VKNERYAWFVVGVLVLANVSSWIDRQILTLLAPPIRRDLDLSLTEMSFLIGLPFAIFFSVMGLPIARLADRGNRRNIIAIGIAAWSVMTALCGLAGGFWRLLLARIGVGVGEASLQAPGTSLIADYFPRERFATAMSVYSMAIFIGAGLAYLIGGAVIGIASAQEMWNVPLIGATRPWQVVFLFVGLPGLLIAALMLAVREPERTQQQRAGVPLRVLFAWISQNLRTFVCLILGFAFSGAVNIGMAAWLATFLVQTHGLTEARAGFVMGILTLGLGTMGVLVGGLVSDAFERRGRSDGPMLVGIIGAAGMLVFGTTYPLASSAKVVAVLLAVVNFFAAFPWGAASAGAAQIVPASMRAQGVALYAFVTSLVSAGLGPTAVAAVTDYVFHDDAKLPYALSIVTGVGMTVAILLFAFGRSAYRDTLARARAGNTG
jgi:MFS family permease